MAGLRRKRKAEAPENHERWLVSYADFITLLFAFFVMMFAKSQVQQDQLDRISESFQQALEQGQLHGALNKLMGKPEAPPPKLVQVLKPADKPPERVADLTTAELMPSMKRLSAELEKEIAGGKLEVRLERRGLVISLREATFFPSGNDLLETATYPTLERIAEAIRGLPNPIRLEGHTDAIPIHTARFRSNWDLSAARAIAMLQLFVDRYGFAPGRMAVAGFAETAPIAPNEVAEGRARNRRVDIVILSEAGLKSEPDQQARQR